MKKNILKIIVFLLAVMTAVQMPNKVIPETAQAGILPDVFSSIFSSDERYAVMMHDTEDETLIFCDVTDELGVSEEEMEETVTDPVLEGYLRENADPAYTAVDKTEIANMMVVKQTMFDKDLLEPDDTMDSILRAMEDGDEDAADKYITQIQNLVAVYDLSNDSDYYVASVNTMRDDENVDSRDDAVFALTDNDANVLTDCYYDAGSGIAYIPKSDFLNDDGEEVLMNVQVQMMQAIHYDTADSEVLTAVGDEDSLQSATATTACFFDLETTVQTDSGMDEDNLFVSVNGIPVEAAAYEYDSGSGELTIAQSSAVIQSVYVAEHKSSVYEKVSKLFAPSVEAYATSFSDMVYTAYDITLPDWVTSGTLLTGTAGYSYNGRSTWYNSYGYGDASALISLISNGGTLDQSKIASQSGGLCNIFVWLENNTLQNNGRTIPALSGITGALHMDCAHVSSPLGTVTGAAINGGRVSQQQTRLRFLHVDRAAGYAVFGIYTVQTHTQTGSGLFKIGIGNPSEEPNYLTSTYRARDAYLPALDIHIEKADADTGEKLAGAVFTVYMDGTEMGTVTTDASGKAAYHWRGDTLYTAYTSNTKTYVTNYTRVSDEDKANIDANSNIYSSAGAAYNAAKAQTLAQVSSALTSLKSSVKHTWKVVESKAPDGYGLNPMVWEQTLSVGEAAAIEIDFTDVSTGAGLKLKKTSGNASLTAGNSCYSLEGTEYGVYATREDAAYDTNRVETLTTDADGNTDTVWLGLGKWYVKEITASKGYKMCDGSFDGADDGIHVVEADTKGEIYTVECAEPPANTPFALLLQKMDYDTGDPTAQGTASLEGAIFALEYYTNTDGSITGTPFKTWYFRTDGNGRFICNNSDYLVLSHTMEDGTILRSDPLYEDSDGNVVYPLGTYRIFEVFPPMYYQNDGYMQFVQNPAGQTAVTTGLKAVIQQDENSGEAYICDSSGRVSRRITDSDLAIHVYDKMERGSVTVYKQESNGSKAPLEGVTFKLVGLVEGDEYIATTNRDGKIVWDNLIPQNYVISEIKTTDGHSLLKDNIEIQLPLEMTLEELNKTGADINQAIYDEASGKYCFYDLTFTVDNSIKFEMPFTGGNKIILYILFVIAFLFVALGTIILVRKKHGLS